MLDEVIRGVLGCVCEALGVEESSTPVCRCYAVVGAPFIPPGGCCECDQTYDGVSASGEATVFFERMFDADPNTLDPVSRVYPCRGGVRAADFTIIVTRCYPAISENGELPDPEELDAAASEIHDQVDAIWKALACCGAAKALRIRDISVDSEPEVGCAAIAARVTAQVSGGVR